jgi:hypothetical protein
VEGQGIRFYQSAFINNIFCLPDWEQEFWKPGNKNEYSSTWDQILAKVKVEALGQAEVVITKFALAKKRTNIAQRR